MRGRDFKFGSQEPTAFSVKLLPTRPVRWTTWWVCLYWPEPIDIPNFPSVCDPWVRSGALRSLIMESSIALCGRILRELNTPCWALSSTFSGLSFCTLHGSAWWFCLLYRFYPKNYIYIFVLHVMLSHPDSKPTTFQNKMRICLVGRGFFLDKSKYIFLFSLNVGSNLVTKSGGSVIIQGMC